MLVLVDGDIDEVRIAAGRTTKRARTRRPPPPKSPRASMGAPVFGTAPISAGCLPFLTVTFEKSIANSKAC
jgi:hypothetical protein